METLILTAALLIGAVLPPSPDLGTQPPSQLTYEDRATITSMVGLHEPKQEAWIRLHSISFTDGYPPVLQVFAEFSEYDLARVARAIAKYPNSDHWWYYDQMIHQFEQNALDLECRYAPDNNSGAIIHRGLIVEYNMDGITWKGMPQRAVYTITREKCLDFLAK